MDTDLIVDTEKEEYEHTLDKKDEQESPGKNLEIYGSSFTEWSTNTFKNMNPEITFKNASVGDCLNLYEKLILDVKWQLIDDENGVNFVLGRRHMFYTPNDSVQGKIKSLAEKKDEQDMEEISKKFNKKNPYLILRDSTEMFVKLGITDFLDTGTIYENKEFIEKKDYDDSVYDTASENGVKKISNNHFAISSYNLIYQEIQVNSNAINTVSHNYENVLGVDQKEMATIIPYLLEKEDGFKNNIMEKVVNPVVDKVDKDASLFSPNSWFGAENDIRAIEFLSTALIEELKWAYQGKIFITYNPDIKAGDSITLIDNVSSSYGTFEIDSFEHVLDNNGMITILNIKAFIQLIDPAIDIYNKKIGLELTSNFIEKIKNKDYQNSEIISLKNLLSYYNKINLQQVRYGKIYNMEEQNWFDDSGRYPEKEGSVRAPGLALKFIPFMKKGKNQIPDTFKEGFFSNVDHAYSTLFNRISGLINDGYYNLTTGVGSWGRSICIYALDFIMSLLTFNVSDLLKVSIGLPTDRAVEELMGNSDISKEEIDILTKDTDYSSWNSFTNQDISIGFFNVMAQKKTNLTPGINNITDKVSFDVLKKAVDEKTKVIKKIINENFDICCCVEMYDSFSFEEIKESYKIENFIKDCKPKGYSTLSASLFTNKYGTEKGITYFKDNIFTTNSSANKINISQSSNSFPITTGDSGRTYIETTVDISHLNYTNENGDLITKLLLIWFHNIYGEDEFKMQSRLDNVEFLLKKYRKTLEVEKEIGIIIFGDFNIEVVNEKQKPVTNEGLKLYLDKRKHGSFKNLITKPTTLSKKGTVTSNLYDNALISGNLLNNKEYLTVSRLIYPYKDKYKISDHVPVFVGMKKRK